LIAAGCLDEQGRKDVVGAARRAARPGNLRDIRFHGCGEVLHTLVRRVRGDDDDKRIAPVEFRFGARARRNDGRAASEFGEGWHVAAALPGIFRTVVITHILHNNMARF
jgi:hypothetical protein